MKLYGTKEIAEELGMRPATLSMWLKRGKIPTPDAQLSMGPVWTARRIEPWIAAQKRRMK